MRPPAPPTWPSQHGLVTEVGAVDGRARRVVDADGLLVTPGFVDIHTHFDGQVTWDDDLTPSCWHGVTTAILGNCGVGFAPVRPDGHTELIELMEGVEDIPGSALSEGIRWAWESFPEYLDALAGRQLALDVGTHVPHAAVRAYVMGERALEDATDTDLDAICAIVRAGMEAGALGFSTGRTAGHRDIRGNPVPGTFAPEAELAAILATLDEVGAGVFEVVPAGVGGEITGDAADAMEHELAWLVRQGERTDPPDHLPRHGTARGRPLAAVVRGRRPGERPWRPAPATGRQPLLRRADGAPVEAQPVPVPAHLPRRARPPAPSRAGPPAARPRDPRPHPGRGARLQRAVPDGPGRAPRPRPRLRPGRLARLRADGGHEHPGDRGATGVDPWEVAYDVLLEADGHEFLLWPLLNYGSHSYDGLLAMMEDPDTVHGLGDSGAHVGLVCDASTNTYMLTHWVRDRTRGRRLPLERAVQRLTSEPARLYGLGDRGVLAPGAKADCNVIDLDGLRLVRPEQLHDLPGGAGRLVQRAVGYVATFVDGVQTIDHDDRTDALPGRLVRGARSRA